MVDSGVSSSVIIPASIIVPSSGSTAAFDPSFNPSFDSFFVSSSPAARSSSADAVTSSFNFLSSFFPSSFFSSSFFCNDDTGRQGS